MEVVCWGIIINFIFFGLTLGSKTGLSALPQLWFCFMCYGFSLLQLLCIVCNYDYEFGSKWRAGMTQWETETIKLEEGYFFNSLDPAKEGCMKGQWEGWSAQVSQPADGETTGRSKGNFNVGQGWRLVFPVGSTISWFKTNMKKGKEQWVWGKWG